MCACMFGLGVAKDAQVVLSCDVAKSVEALLNSEPRRLEVGGTGPNENFNE